MDGTLSEPRKKVNIDIIDPLVRLSKHADIGIVTGSPMTYLEQQCHPLWDFIGHCTTLFPCNGTKKYIFAGDGKFTLESETNMIEEIGRESYNIVINECAKEQYEMMHNQSLPFTGTFLQYRGSLLNWCPIGRDAGDDERQAWIEVDSEKNIREKYKLKLESFISGHDINLTVTLGGSTSFDIYPGGWDKTYVLNHLSNYDKIYFIGDKCTGSGNDRSLYENLLPYKSSHETKDPHNTVQIIEKLIKAMED